ncbi:MAG: PD-(D/E)XK nuclease family protein [Pseudanabaena sp. M135S2SP2A07QC]|jgi:CRISPR/Cas system-associated exonuclease Cas4 (RecB family)|nr:PD-(D/E)XK nuclease family protein [Pseudanabaena sp. M074S1SP2A07QC]MCA6553377.1 PD-(D/E)XK nuclease family protein [Pseudanabaena sp. M135S2SP2A07QC]MCA6571646.1 PD-(D/E)XK nuclease family protein [Pseudanabaena sp. M065S1SP2A07QC]
MVLQERKSAMTAISPITSISQGHLNIWEICRRRYLYSFLEELSLPEADLQRKKNLLLGSNFHLLMQQKELGLDVSSLASSDPKLRSWIDAFEHQPPEMIKGDRLCEHRRTLEMQIEMSLNHSENGDHGQAYFVLTAIYDFLILGDRKAQILDWKTHQVAIAAEKLKTNWQTRLYLYLLAKTTNYAPEQLSMTYWFANTAESVIISYSQIENDQTEKKLQHILGQIAQAQDYPKLASDSSECVYCEFRDRCDRGDMLTSNIPSNIFDIPEVTV